MFGREKKASWEPRVPDSAQHKNLFFARNRPPTIHHSYIGGEAGS